LKAIENQKLEIENYIAELKNQKGIEEILLQM